MKKPLTLIPPAQAEALYDEALRDARRESNLETIFPGRNSPHWEARDWDDDDAAQASEDRYRMRGLAAASAHD